MLDKTERINELLDFYAVLLTAKQQEVMGFYYHEDLSLKEIAEELKISRSAVFDLIKRSVNTLEEYEEKLQLAAKYRQRAELYEQIKKLGSKEIQNYIEKCYETE